MLAIFRKSFIKKFLISNFNLNENNTSKSININNFNLNNNNNTGNEIILNGYYNNLSLKNETDNNYNNDIIPFLS